MNSKNEKIRTKELCDSVLTNQRLNFIQTQQQLIELSERETQINNRNS